MPMNKAAAIEVDGSVLKFLVVFTSASDHGHGGGSRRILYEGFDAAEAVRLARQPAQWGYHSIEVEGWR